MSYKYNHSVNIEIRPEAKVNDVIGAFVEFLQERFTGAFIAEKVCVGLAGYEDGDVLVRPRTATYERTGDPVLLSMTPGYQENQERLKAELDEVLARIDKTRGQNR